MRVYGFTLDFRPQNIVTAAERSEARMLGHVGGYLRTTARRLIKKGRGKQTSQTGDPPLTWTNRYKASIFYAYDRMTHSVVAGGIPFGPGAIPGKIENGGMEFLTDRKTGLKKLAKYTPRPAMRIALAIAIQKALPKALKDYIQ